MTYATSKELAEAFRNRAAEARLKVECAGDGPISATIAIIAEAPGKVEQEKGIPLVGSSGSKLWQSLRPYGIDRRFVYITNVAKRVVSFGNDKRNPIGKHELDTWIGLLRWELSQLPNLKYVLVLGNMALRALVGEDGIGDWRGSVIEGVKIRHIDDSRTTTVTAVCTFNPAATQHDPSNELPFLMDLDKFHQVIDGTFTPHNIEYFINPTLEEALTFIDKMEADGLPVALDIETPSMHTACIGLANSAHSGMCISFRRFGENVFTLEEERVLRRRLQAFLSNPNVRIVVQNGAFDIGFLWWDDKIEIHKAWFDTMLAHHTLYPELPHDLGYLTTQYTTHPFYKNERTAWRENGDIDRYWRYNVTDCCMTIAAMQRMLVELREQGLSDFFFDHVMHLQKHLIEMTLGGVKIDMTLKEQITRDLSNELNDKLTEVQDAVRDAIGDPDYVYNPMSTAHRSDVFFNKLKLVGRGSSTDEENRTRMFNHPRTTEAARKVLRLTGKYMQERKFFGTYAKMPVDPDGRIRCEWRQTGTQRAPGRLSSASTLWGSGTNLQNQPSRAYPMFIADEGYCFVYFDMAQAEARIVGWYANIEKWIEQFERARVDGVYDAHRALAAEMFGIPYDEVPTFDHYDSSKGHPPPEGVAEYAPTIRFKAKRCRHGLNYRMGPDRLASTTGLPLHEAITLHRLYHRATPELVPWWADLEKEIRRDGALYNAYGRRKIALGRVTADDLESIVAFKPQSTNGDHVARVIYKSHEDPRWPSHARIRLNVHDALIALVREDQAKTALSIMKGYAEQPIIINGRPLIIPADCKISVPDEKGIHRWSTLQKVEIEAAKITV